MFQAVYDMTSFGNDCKCIVCTVVSHHDLYIPSNAGDRMRMATTWISPNSGVPKDWAKAIRLPLADAAAFVKAL